MKAQKNSDLDWSLGDTIEALRWELHELGRGKSDELWRALDQASTDLKRGDVEAAGVLTAFAAQEVGRLTAVTKPTAARQYRRVIRKRLVLREWGGLRKKPSRNSFALKVSKKFGISPRRIHGILHDHLGSSSIHPGRPRRK